MLFLIGDENGRITQASKVYSHVKETEKQYNEREIEFTMLKHPRLLSTERWMINKGGDSLMRVKKRPLMAVAIDKTVIKAGGNDKAVLTGAPKDVRCAIDAAGQTLFDVVLPDGELELSIPVPISYTVRLTKWPWVDYTATIEAVA